MPSRTGRVSISNSNGNMPRAGTTTESTSATTSNNVVVISTGNELVEQLTSGSDYIHILKRR